jgi:hypothetical protein
MTTLLVILLFLIAAATVWHFSVKNAVRAATRRAENAQLVHDAMIREENRQSAYAGRVVKP